MKIMTELDNKEKIKVLKLMLKGINRMEMRGEFAGLCNAFIKAIKFEGFIPVKNAEEMMLEAIPELIPFKPEQYHYGFWWLDPLKYDVRKDMINTLITTLS